jgi:ubiquinone biosynthesis protein
MYLTNTIAKAKRDTLVGKLIRSYSEILGPTFIKISQTLAYRDDLFSQLTLKEIKPLLNSCPSELHLEKKVAQQFPHVTELKLIGSGTIAQVYSGYIKDKKYAFKVKRTNIVENIKQDIEFIKNWLKFINKQFPQYNIYKRFNTIENSILTQTDFKKEIKNCHIFEKLTEKLPNIKTAHVYEELSSDDIIVMDFIEGTPLCDTVVITDQNLLKQILKLWLNGLLDYGIIHGDLHMGNLIQQPNGDIVILDFGLVFDVKPSIQIKFFEYMNYFIRRDIEKIIDWIFCNYIVGEKTEVFKNKVCNLVNIYINKEQIKFWDFSKELDILMLEHNLELNEEYVELEISKTTSFVIMKTLNNDKNMLLSIFEELDLM